MRNILYILRSPRGGGGAEGAMRRWKICDDRDGKHERDGNLNIEHWTYG